MNYHTFDPMNKWTSYSDKALAEQIGHFVKQQRMQQNRTQDQLASAAGMSRSTLSLLERGETVTVPTLLQVLRALDKLELMGVFEVQEQISPLALAKLQKNKRQRARSPKKDKDDNTSW